MTKLKLTVFSLGVLALVLAGCEKREKIATGIFAVDPVWTFETQDDIIATPQVSGDTIILRTEKQVIALDAPTRNVLWTADSQGTINQNAPPIISDSFVIVPEDDNPLAAYDLASGELIWRNCIRSGNPPGCASPSAQWEINDLQSDGRVVVISRYTGDLSGYDISNGKYLWEIHSLRRGGPSFGIAGSEVYFDWHDENTRQLQAVSLVTGSYSWDYNIDDISGRMIIQNGVMYLVKGTVDTTEIVALALDSSSTIWERPFPGDQPFAGVYLTLESNVLYAAADRLAAISIDEGSVIWETDVTQGMRKPVVYGDILLVRDDHILYAFDKSTGAEIGQQSLELTPHIYDVELNPAVYGDLVLIPVGAKQLGAYRLESP